MNIELTEEALDCFIGAIPVREDTLELVTKVAESYGYELDIHTNSDIVFLVKRETKGSTIIESFILSKSDWLIINGLGHIQKMSDRFVQTTWDFGDVPA